MAQLDYDDAALILERTFDEVQQSWHVKTLPPVAPVLRPHLDALFSSNTQAYREVLIGAALARLQNKEINVHFPYVGHGPTAYNGRDLDEVVVNPFLQAKQIPSSRGPFLNVFRRGVKFEPATREGLRDKKGYDSFLAIIDYLSATASDEDLTNFLKALLTRFLELREESHIAIARVQRLSLVQLQSLIDKLLAIPSGGRFPVFLVVATFQTLNDVFAIGWTIQYQNINVADAASGEAGDVTIRRGDEVLMAAEITERVVSKSRVVSTFTAKIAPLSIQDYLFFVKETDPEAYKQAHQYFSQGHEVNFLQIRSWIYNILAVLGPHGRNLFVSHFIDLLSLPHIPRSMKVGWNDSIRELTAG